MNRKYLDDIGVVDRPDKWGSRHDKRRKDWHEQRLKYGFDERETWSLDSTFYIWLYERLMMYKEAASEIVDLTYHKFKYKTEEYNQMEVIDRMLSLLKSIIAPEKEDDSSDYAECLARDRAVVEMKKEVAELWALVLPAMWW